MVRKVHCTERRVYSVHNKGRQRLGNKSGREGQKQEKVSAIYAKTPKLPYALSFLLVPPSAPPSLMLLTCSACTFPSIHSTDLKRWRPVVIRGNNELCGNVGVPLKGGAAIATHRVGKTDDGKGRVGGGEGVGRG